LSVTMREVAQEADVSIKTVSRVVNQQGEISDQTRTRVLAAIDRLGYRPSKVARALVTRRTDTIGLICGDIANPYLAEVARGVLDTAQGKQIEVFLCNTDGNPEAERRAFQSLLDHNVDGAIAFPLYANYDWIKSIAHPDHPLVLINCEIPPQPGLGIVNTELRKGAKLAVDYLVQKGHRCIGMLAGNVAPKEKIHRVQGYREGLEQHGLGYRDDLVLTGDPVIEFGLAGGWRLLTEHPEVTAIFCYNDLIAMGVIQACKDLGKQVPEDCAVVGYDNNKFSALTNPALTTIHVNKYEIGRQASKRILEILNYPGSVYPPTQLDVELIVRESA
jgi:LacI family transcriptional regulator